MARFNPLNSNHGSFLLFRLGVVSTRYGKMKNDMIAEGLAIYSGKKKLVEFGVVRPTILKAFGIKQEVIYADFEWSNVLECIQGTTIKVEELPKHPEVKRDLALLLDEEINFVDLHDFARQTEKKLLKQVDLFDVYVGDKLPEGKKSYALSFILQDKSKTLTDKQIDKIMKKLQQGFERQFKAELR